MTEVSSVSSWKQKARTLTLPSGNVVGVQNPGMKTFLVNGTIPNSLMSLAEKALQKGRPLDDSEMRSIVESPEKIADMLKMVDVITMGVVTEPKVHPAPETAADRDQDKLYVDEIDDEDKLFIFQWASGGTTDLERFRAELAGTLAPLQSGDDVAGTSV